MRVKVKEYKPMPVKSFGNGSFYRDEVVKAFKVFDFFSKSVCTFNGTSRIQKTEYPWYMAFSDILSPILSGYKPKGPPTTQILFPAIQSVL